MASKKTTRRALFMSILSLLLCCSMLVGTTFAWFTDEVKSGKNQILAGNLDVELYYQLENQSDWTPVNADTNVFMKDALWEPGHTEVVKLKVVNAGSLALKYQLGVNVASETGSVNAAGNDFKLSNYIKFGIIEGDMTYNRDQAVAAVDSTATTLGIAYSSQTIELLPKTNNEKIVTMVVYMPTSVGNEANHMTGKAQPTINLGINLMATQVENEFDSFGNDYDANSPFNVWDGTVPAEMPETLVVDGTTKTIHVKDAAAFVYLSTLSDNWDQLYTDGNGTEYPNYANGAGEDYYYRNRWTVSLDANIDLSNQQITPIRIVIGENTGAATFNGNGHTIRNINTTTGLFADNNPISYSNLVLANVTATNGALTGSSSTSISGVTVKNATVSGTEYVGGLVGYIYGNVRNCKVMNSSVTASGKEAGGLIGYIATSDASAEVTNNEVYNVTVHAGNRAAGLVAQVNVNVKVYNNIIDTVTVTAADTSTYKPNAVVSNAITPADVYNNTVKNAKVASGDSTLPDGLYKDEDGNYYATNTNGLNAGITMANAGDTIVLGRDVTYTGNNYANITEDITLDLNGNTLNTTSLGIVAKAGTIKNGTVTNPVGSRAALRTWSGVSIENVVIESPENGGITVASGNSLPYIKNVTIKAKTYGIELQYGASVDSIENVNIDAGENGIVVQAGTIGNITNSVIKGKNTGIWGQLKGTYDLKITLDGTNKVSGTNYGIYLCDEGATPTPGSATLNYGADTINGAEKVKLAFGQMGKVTVNGAKIGAYISTADELVNFAKQVNENGVNFSGLTVYLTNDIDLNNAVWTPIGQTGATQFMGTFDGNGHTIKNLKIDSSAQTGANYSSGLFGWLNNATVKNLTVEGATVTGNHNVGVIAGYMEATGCTISNCHVIGATVVAKHANDDACGDKVGVIVGHAGNAGVKVENCTATNSTVTAGRDAGQIAGAAQNANVTGCSATNVTVTAGGDCTGANINDAVIGRVLG